LAQIQLSDGSKFKRDSKVEKKERKKEVFFESVANGEKPKMVRAR
jgi:hypothetical protein